MATIELPNEVAQELLLAANLKNMTVSDYIIFLAGGDYHPDNGLQKGDFHPVVQTNSPTTKCVEG